MIGSSWFNGIAPFHADEEFFLFLFFLFFALSITWLFRLVKHFLMYLEIILPYWYILEACARHAALSRAARTQNRKSLKKRLTNDRDGV